MSGRPDLGGSRRAVPDGATVGVGGAGSAASRSPPCSSWRAPGRRDLDLVTFVGGLEVEMLLAAGALRSVTSSYVSLGLHGARPRFSEAVADGGGRRPRDERVDARRRPSRRDDGHAVPADARRPRLRPRRRARLLHRRRPVQRRGVPRRAGAPARTSAIIHAWRADGSGNVQVPWPPDHLWDVDVLVARASASTIVCAEEVVPRDVVAASNSGRGSSASRSTCSSRRLAARGPDRCRRCCRRRELAHWSVRGTSGRR